MKDPQAFYRIVWNHVEPHGRYNVDEPNCQVNVGPNAPGRIVY